MSWVDPVTAGGMPVSGGVISHQQADDEIVDIELDHATILALAATTWATGTPYILEQLVTATPSGAIGPGLYQCILAHTSSGSTFPGAGTYWKALYPAPTSIATSTTISVTASPYNADNTGATDATTAINSAISALPTASFTYTCTSTSAGNTISFPATSLASTPGFVSAFDVGQPITVGSTNTTIASVVSSTSITTTAAVTSGNTSVTVTRHVGNIFFPVGTYLTSSGLTIPGNVSISGQGVGGTTLISTSTSSSSGILTLVGQSTVSDITINTTTRIAPLYITGFNIHLNRVTTNATGSYQNGVQVVTNCSPYFENCSINGGISTVSGQFYFCTFTGPYYSKGYSVIMVNPYGLTFSNCNFTYGTTNSVNYGAIGIIAGSPQNVAVQNCSFTINSNAAVVAIYLVNGYNTFITGNTIAGSSAASSIDVSGTENFSVINNCISSGGGTSTTGVINVNGSVFGIINNNNIAAVSSSAIAGIYLLNNGNYTLSNISISNNWILSNTSSIPCVTLNGAGTCIVSGNSLITSSDGTALLINDTGATGNSGYNLISSNSITGTINIVTSTQSVLAGNYSFGVSDTGTQTLFAGDTRTAGSGLGVYTGGTGTSLYPTTTGHSYSSGTAPTVAAGAQASSVSPTAGGNDTHQTITVTALSSGNAAGALCTVTYNQTYAGGGVPTVSLTAASAAAVAAGLYISASSTTAFTVSCANAPSASASIVFNWKAQG